MKRTATNHSRPSNRVPEKVSDAIWKTSEQVAGLLRNSSRGELRDRAGNILSDELSGRQTHVVLTIRALTLENHAGISLKALAKYLDVSPSSASVMVGNLVSRGFLERTASPTDRRAVRITLSTRANAFFEAADAVIDRTITSIADELGMAFLLRWRDTLNEVKRILLEREARRRPRSTRARRT